ncbi:MAG: hypothetical protein AB7S81_07160, partial [Bdellovibrionales bacterium]
SNGISECAQMAVPDAEHYDLQKIRIGTRLPQHTSFRPLQEKDIQAVEDFISKRAKEIEGASPEEILKEFRTRLNQIQTQEEELKISERQCTRPTRTLVSTVAAAAVL